jgi:biotin synthase
MNTILPKIKNYTRNHPKVKQMIYQTIDNLYEKNEATSRELCFLLTNITKDETKYLFNKAFQAKIPYYQNKVYLRALIEISNHCKQGCLYCGISKHVTDLERYRLSEDDIIAIVDEGFNMGFRTFVIQGGEDLYYTDERLVHVLKTIKTNHPNVRVTLSLGERSYESYKKLYDAGADRYLLRHEAASNQLYQNLHPMDMSLANRKQCLRDLKDIGYQVGAGFMVGSPTQTNYDLVEDLMFLKILDPHMIGIGPYLSHHKTPLKGNMSGTLDETLIMVALTRLLLPKVLLPATTALGTLDKEGREKALLAGANVMMPNIGLTENKPLYEIYENKICVNDQGSTCNDCIEVKINKYEHVVDRSVGDHIDFERGEVV